MEVMDDAQMPKNWRSEPRFMDCLSPACGWGPRAESRAVTLVTRFSACSERVWQVFFACEAAQIATARREIYACAMKAIRVERFGEPEVMKFVEVPDLQISAGQILVQIRAAGVNPVETYIRAGTLCSKTASSLHTRK